MDLIQRILKEMEREQPSPSANKGRNPLRVLSDMFYFSTRLAKDIEPSDYSLKVAQWGEQVRRSSSRKVGDNGETYYGQDVGHLSGVEIPARIHGGVWSVFLGSTYRNVIEDSVRHPTHFLSVVPVGENLYGFTSRPA